MHVPTFGRPLFLLALSVPLATAPAWPGAEPASWKKAEAAAYLDGRAEAWFAFPSAGRGEATTRTTCLACHTSLPYALARPALRKLLGETQPAPAERKLLEQVRSRVTHWGELDTPAFRLLYDFSDAKKKESRGTEAVLNALVLASDDRARELPTPGETTRQAFANLWSAQASGGGPAGSWDWLDFGLQPWESTGARYFGATLAALAVGTAPGSAAPGSGKGDDRPVQALRAYLRAHRAEQNLHNRTWLLWASNGLDGLVTPDERKALIQELLDRQEADGGWRLASLGNFTRGDGTPQEPTSDGYATGLILHALQTAGVPKATPKVAAGLNWLRANQASTGEWRASSVNKERDPASHVGRFMSDAATAYAVLALSH